MPAWTPAFALDELAVGDVRVVKSGPERVAVFRLDADDLVAVDNRCPHEGYPLSQGGLSRDGQGRCLLTCHWHNWKVDLADGSCVMGGEAVRRLPLRVVAGRVGPGPCPRGSPGPGSPSVLRCPSSVPPPSGVPRQFSTWYCQESASRSSSLQATARGPLRVCATCAACRP